MSLFAHREHGLRRLCIAVLLSLSVMTIVRANAEEQHAQIAAACQFLTAVSTLDMRTVRDLMPDDPKQLFGPCDFSEIPLLSDPIVRGNQGLMHWSGKTKDPRLADAGTIMFRKEPRENGAWKVRQICYYDAMPGFTRSAFRFTRKTRADRQAEEKLHNIGERYVQAWLTGDYSGMFSYWYDWTMKDISDDKPVSVQVTSSTVSKNYFNAPTVDMCVTIEKRFLAARIRGRYKCSLVVVKENGHWLVCGNRIEFYR